MEIYINWNCIYKFSKLQHNIEKPFNGTTYYTGGGSGTTFVNRTNQSSTGNIYGIYDLSGNAYEYVTGYYKEGNFSSADSTFTTGISDAYSTAYRGTSENTDFIYGDATYETHGWNSDEFIFINSDLSFFLRGGYYRASISSGVFQLRTFNGYSHSDVSFRVCLTVQ